MGAFLAFAVVLGSMTGLACVARTVAAEAVGYVAENAFFTGALGDGVNLGGNLTQQGGSRKGNERGLYGGSTQIDVCDPDLLLDFLLQVGNGKKKAAWAKALGIGAKNGNVKKFVKSLTEVVLANDTLVANHGYKKGEANRYDAVLEAGTAVLVDVFGVPRVKCNCGNPLAVSEHKPGDVKVEFKGKDKGNKEWKVKKDQVVRVEEAEQPQESLTVVDVEDPDKQVEIALPEEPELTGGTGGDGETGESPSPELVEIPRTRGLSVADATQQLEALGFVVETRTVDDPDVAPGLAAGTEPEGGGTAAPDSAVTLLVAAEPTKPETVTVPNVVGLPQPEAEAEINAAGLVPAVNTTPASADQVGLVVQQEPAGGEAEASSTVTLVVGVESPSEELVGGTDTGTG
ncbi:PASTA domain-containing protein [Streptomyces actuosus]|uniref:PASTA domain-containing protein n=1 Tax=Streptomyces actuosus TaxID=1885 RepID=A0ABS2VJE7_STRAS|nr:DUF6777 domain-containing protein [Streptomyces actuosus]MBN0043211.1 PASTA domain-containing protein [Streptomyces actuosus]